MRGLAEPPKVSAVVIFKDRLDHLKQCLPRLMAEPFHEVIAVDYDCPAGGGDWVAEHYPAVKLVRIADKPVFNVADARNLGALAATAPWLLFIDVDVLLEPGFLASASPRLIPGAFLIAEPRLAELYGTMFVSRADFSAIGGFDDAFQGWGCEDVELMDRLEALGRELRTFDGSLSQPIVHTDTLRTRHHEITDRYLAGAINALYRTIKNDLAAHGRTLDAAARADLYNRVRGGFAAGVAPANLEILFKQENAFGLHWTTTLKYDLRPSDDLPQDNTGPT